MGALRYAAGNTPVLGDQVVGLSIRIHVPMAAASVLHFARGFCT
jgi:hypothetical protein